MTIRILFVNIVYNINAIKENNSKIFIPLSLRCIMKTMLVRMFNNYRDIFIIYQFLSTNVWR